MNRTLGLSSSSWIMIHGLHQCVSKWLSVALVRTSFVYGISYGIFLYMVYLFLRCVLVLFMVLLMKNHCWWEVWCTQSGNGPIQRRWRLRAGGNRCGSSRSRRDWYSNCDSLSIAPLCWGKFGVLKWSLQTDRKSRFQLLGENHIPIDSPIRSKKLLIASQCESHRA